MSLLTGIGKRVGQLWLREVPFPHPHGSVLSFVAFLASPGPGSVLKDQLVLVIAGFSLRSEATSQSWLSSDIQSWSRKVAKQLPI
jgi:hypothetical protein